MSASSSSSSSVNKDITETIATSIVNLSRGPVEHHWSLGSLGKPVGNAIIASTMILSSSFIASKCLFALNQQMLARKDTNRELISTLQTCTASVVTLTLTLNAGLVFYYHQCSRK